jgi:hypothetical protein
VDVLGDAVLPQNSDGHALRCLAVVEAQRSAQALPALDGACAVFVRAVDVLGRGERRAPDPRSPERPKMRHCGHWFSAVAQCDAETNEGTTKPRTLEAPAQSQEMRVAGLTITSAELHALHSLDKATQKERSSGLSCGRFRPPAYVASCCLRARFSRATDPRLLRAAGSDQSSMKSKNRVTGGL